jgi:hypothetical protein
MSTEPSDQSPDADETGDEAASGFEMSDTVQQLVAEQVRLREQPATEEQMEHIWPLWNALPDKFSADERYSILTCDDDEVDEGDIVDPTEYRQELKVLRERFPTANLPINENRYHQALEQALQWAKHVDFIQTNSQLH